ATGPWWPSSTIDGRGSPGRQIAMRESSPLVAMRPSGRKATALTAPSWKRSTCSAALRSSDQRIAEVSKLPEIAFLPSGEIASARTGPPWPRNCACAASDAADNTNATTASKRTIIASRFSYSRFTRAHAERADPTAHRLVAQRSQERLHCRPLAAAFDQQEVVVLGRDRDEAETVELRDRFDRNSPVRAPLRHRGGDR